LYRSHFPKDVQGIVIDYKNGGEVGLFIRGQGPVWHFPYRVMTLLERGRSDLLPEWEEECRVAREKRYAKT